MNPSEGTLPTLAELEELLDENERTAVATGTPPDETAAFRAAMADLDLILAQRAAVSRDGE